MKRMAADAHDVRAAGRGWQPMPMTFAHNRPGLGTAWHLMLMMSAGRSGWQMMLMLPVHRPSSRQLMLMMSAVRGAWVETDGR